MRNYIILAAARTGSTYIGTAISKQLRLLEPNFFYGGEMFRWKEYFQLSPPSTIGPGSFTQLEFDPLLVNEYDRKQPRGPATDINMVGQGQIVRETVETSWAELGPVSFRRAWEESQRRLTILENSYSPWLVKLMPEHLECIDLYRLNKLMQKDSTALIIVYRSFLWDWFLSSIAVKQSGVWNENVESWNKPQIEPSRISKELVAEWFVSARQFINLILTYRRWAERVVPYERFSGDPRRDACDLTGINLFPDATDHIAKLWNLEEKEQMISNLDELKSIFAAYCKLLGFPSGKLVI